MFTSAPITAPSIVNSPPKTRALPATIAAATVRTVPPLAVKSTDPPAANTSRVAVNVALTVLTNYVNNVALTDIDFPQVTAKLAA